MLMSEERTTMASDELHEIIVKSQKESLTMAMFLLKDNPNIVIYQETLYQYNGKCYDLITDKDLDRLYLSFCINHGIPGAFKNISLVIRAFSVYPTIPVIEEMNEYPDFICLNNGILNIRTKELLPHDPKYYFDSFVNIDYIPSDNDCPAFKQYLFNTFSGDKDTITNIIRLGGYLIDTSCKAERMFLFDGVGSNGKSVLINTFSLFFSKAQITPLSLDTMATNNFDRELLIKSRVNLCAEQNKSYLPSEELKKIVTGDLMSVGRKFKIPMVFNPKTKIVVACNGYPTFKDTTHALYRRLMLFKFRNVYLEQDEYDQLRDPVKVRAYIKDKMLMDKIKSEKTAILNLFIEGLIDLRNNSYTFISTEESRLAMNAYKRDSDTVREFLEDNYEANELYQTPLSHVYNHYRDWYSRNVSSANNLKFRSNEMGKRIKDIFNIESLGQKYIFNKDLGTNEKETMYPIRLIPAPTLPTEEILTTEQASQQGIIF